MNRALFFRGALAATAIVGVAAPATAAVDLEVKRAIVEVVLDNLGVSASDEFIVSLSQDLDTAELDATLVTSVTDLLDTGGDPRTVIESATDADGDGVPDEGAAMDSGKQPNPNSTEKADNADDKSENSSTGKANGNGKTNSGKTTESDDAEDENDDAEDDENDDEDSEDEDSEDEQDDD